MIRLPLCVHLLDVCNSSLGSYYCVVLQNVIYIDGAGLSGLNVCNVLCGYYYVLSLSARTTRALVTFQVIHNILELLGLDLVKLQLIHYDELVLLYSACKSRFKSSSLFLLVKSDGVISWCRSEYHAAAGPLRRSG